jgi:hypothetical protein
MSNLAEEKVNWPTVFEIPNTVAVCPECKGILSAQWPSEDDFSLDCENEAELEDSDRSSHRWWQREWQPVIDRVKRWMTEKGFSP